MQRELELDSIEQKYKKLAATMNKEIEMNYEASNDPRYSDAGVEPITLEGLTEMKTEARWDVAWQVFDEVNQGLNQEGWADLRCLNLDDALAIAKQKIFDNA